LLYCCHFYYFFGIGSKRCFSSLLAISLVWKYGENGPHTHL
jgi:hypothetical protein